MEYKSPAEKGPNSQTGRVPAASLAENVQYMKDQLQSPEDLLIKSIVMAAGQKGAVACIDGLVDKQLKVQILQTLMQERLSIDSAGAKSNEAEQGAEEGDGSGDGMPVEAGKIPVQDARYSTDWDDILLSILTGDTALFVEGAKEVLLLGSKGWKSRAVEEPQTETIIRGPRDGFTEDIRTNTALLRRRVKDVNLRFESFRIGRRGRKDVIVAYLNGVVNPQLVEEVKRRITTIDIDDPEGSGYIEQWITDRYWSPYPQILNTERPDKVAGAIMQGKVALLIDGTPFQLIMPIMLSSFIQSPEDYYQNWILSSVLRILRVISAFVALFLPGLYIALLEYHHGLLPSKLAFSIAGTREGVPFPAVVETFLMETTLELLREAGIRLPKPIGQTIGVVGGLVIGEAAVTAGIVSPVMVVVVAVTAIASFAIPSYGFAVSIRLLRFGIMLAAAIFGLYGIVLALIMNCIHLANLKSFGVAYTGPLAPLRLGDWRDFIIRVPVMNMVKRPAILETMDEVRINTDDQGEKNK
ncbi:spore germination protein [Paenibacillus kobensis]|uniref:spore germination protein n=1 Tax=Paenibacillus kobensis TaxID=59841 RepID=UPI000FDBA478|nr:spore germination protein [Paenibacillus kobensis]